MVDISKGASQHKLRQTGDDPTSGAGFATLEVEVDRNFSEQSSILEELLPVPTQCLTRCKE